MSCCGGDKTCGVASPNVHEFVSSFYASKARDKEGLPMGANLCAVNCPLATKMTDNVKKTLDMVHEDVKNSYFGCGLPYPFDVQGMRVLDFGSGTGRDVFLLGGLAGPLGHVTGVDMTPAMVERATSMIPYHAQTFGFSNCEFVLGELENLDKIEALKKDSFDIIVSNCVINLCQDKKRVLKNAFHLLKSGGELCFSDVYTEKPLPENIKNDQLVWNECFGGALPWNEFQAICKEIGFLGPFEVSSEDYKPVAGPLVQQLEGLKFWSKTVRLFKPPKDVESMKCNLNVQYLGTVADAKDKLLFAENLVFKSNECVRVSEDVAVSLKASRFSKHFKFNE